MPSPPAFEFDQPCYEPWILENGFTTAEEISGTSVSYDHISSPLAISAFDRYTIPTSSSFSTPPEFEIWELPENELTPPDENLGGNTTLGTTDESYDRDSVPQALFYNPLDLTGAGTLPLQTQFNFSEFHLGLPIYPDENSLGSSTTWETAHEPNYQASSTQGLAAPSQAIFNDTQGFTDGMPTSTILPSIYLDIPSGISHYTQPATMGIVEDGSLSMPTSDPVVYGGIYAGHDPILDVPVHEVDRRSAINTLEGHASKARGAGARRRRTRPAIYSCMQCGETFTVKERLKTHHNRFHAPPGQQKRYPCMHCRRYDTAYPGDLRRHWKRCLLRATRTPPGGS